MSNWLRSRNTAVNNSDQNNPNDIINEENPSSTAQPSTITLSEALQQKIEDQQLPAIFSYSRDEDFYYQYTIKKVYEETQFNCFNVTGTISMNDISTMEQYWCFITNFLVSSFHWKFWFGSRDKVYIATTEDENILFNNYLIGVPRIRQVRVTNQSCEIHDEFKQRFKHCYGFYSSSTEETGMIYPTNDGVTGNQSCWMYATAGELESRSYAGQLATYYGGGYTLELTLDEETDKAMLVILKDNLWISRATRAIFVDFATLNTNTESMCFIKLVFEFPPTGGVYPSTNFYLIQLNRYYMDLEHYGLMVLICQILIIFFTIYFTLVEINEFIVLKYKSYFASWWTILDLIILVLLWMSIIGHILLCFLVGYNVRNKLSENVLEQRTYRSFDSLISWHSIHASIVAWTLFFAALKFLRLLKIFRFVRNLFEIIFQASYNILAFIMLFSTIILACGLIAHLQFGDKVRGLQTFPSACCSLVLALVGHFDLQLLIEYDTFIGSTFCYFYIFLVFFIVTNIIIAILNERYWIVNRLLSREHDEDLWEPFRFKLQEKLYKMGCKDCSSRWFKYDQLSKSEKKYNALKDEYARRTEGTLEEAEEFLKNANVTKKNAAKIPKKDIRSLMRGAGGTRSDKDLNKRLSRLEAEIRRLNTELNSRG
ncbi:polycystic kidney disease 2-like 1 protein isoform X2 [Nilaparvata lugens]|uniref:polycystic kidney disease 2-like 1 protein isoform X2 n=1 Tax=Nilaparvata lugens TaxID=108931 RepID=UPI00193CD8E5|nr:polycystic kidney disease 2-like 1 protein isoform X2 [Nilaparvata lugens]